MIVGVRINRCPSQQQRPNPAIVAVRVAKSVSIVIALMAVLLLRTPYMRRSTPKASIMGLAT